MNKIFNYSHCSTIGRACSRLYRLSYTVFSIAIFLTLLPSRNCQAQELVSYSDSCVDINENNLFEALYLSFGADSTCWILNDKQATLFVIYVDSLCRVTDSVLIVNSINAGRSRRVREMLLNTMRKHNMTFMGCYETAHLIEDPSFQRLCKLKNDCRSYLISHYNNHIPVRAWVSKSDFLKWVEKRSETKFHP